MRRSVRAALRAAVFVSSCAPIVVAIPAWAAPPEEGSLAVLVVDGRGLPVDSARGHASLQRTPPDRLPDDPAELSGDPDAVRFVVVGEPDELPSSVHITSRAEDGTLVDMQRDVPLASAPCPKGTSRPSQGGAPACAETLPIRAVADDIDRLHPLVRARSIKAELGGLLGIYDGTRELAALRVGGPRITRFGPIERFRARLRVHVIRLAPGGPPPTGLGEPGTVAVVRSEVERANALWGACGISFGPPEELDISIVDPPGSHLVSLGCDIGLPASGGVISFRAEGRPITVQLAAGTLPDGAARAVAAEIEQAGLSVVISDNEPIGSSELGSTDVLVRKRDGTLATLEPPESGRVSTDATLSACIGEVDLRDGLQHFGDVDAIAGTVEERTLIKAFDDGDPSTLEVFLIPSFAGGGRIGESFIFGDAGAIRNVVIEDRGGLRADRASFALAHEVGHVLLDEPGHPDDYGTDTPTRLMDADAANSSAYGPRRLLVAECERALLQSGPASPAPLLTPWPLGALPQSGEFE